MAEQRTEDTAPRKRRQRLGR